MLSFRYKGSYLTGLNLLTALMERFKIKLCIFAKAKIIEMKKLKDSFNKWKDYSLDLIMYGFFILFILILFIFFS